LENCKKIEFRYYKFFYKRLRKLCSLEKILFTNYKNLKEMIEMFKEVMA